MKLKDLRGKFGEKFIFDQDVVSKIKKTYVIVENPQHKDVVSFMDTDMTGGFIYFNNDEPIMEFDVTIKE